MGLFGGSDNVQTTFTGKDNLSPVVRGIRKTMDQFKRDAAGGFGLAVGFSVWGKAKELINAVGDAMGDAMEDQASVDRMTTAIRANATAWDGDVDAINAVIMSRQRLGFADDELRDSLTLLVAATHDVTGALDLQKTAADLARFKNISLVAASEALIKVEAGQYRILKSLGIQLREGATQTEALAAVQKVAAGQAKTYGRSQTGQLKAMRIGFDEFKESVGRALNDALMPFFHTIVDISNQTPDLDSALGRLTQRYRDMIQVKKDDAEASGSLDDEITRGLMSVFMAQDLAIHDFTGTLHGYAEQLGVTRKDLALFTEAGLTLGKTLPEIRAVLDELVRTDLGQKMRKVALSYDRSLTGMADETDHSVRQMVADLGPGGPLEGTLTGLTGIVKGSLKAARRTALAGMEDIVWALKHPMAEADLERFYRTQIRRGMRAMHQAEDKGNAVALAKAAAFVAAYKLKLAELQQAYSSVGAYISSLDWGVPGSDSGGIYDIDRKNPRKVAKWRRKHGRNAIGGIASGETLVGEYGPEIVQLGSAKANVATARQSSGDIILKVDGDVLWRWIDKRMGRQLVLA